MTSRLIIAGFVCVISLSAAFAGGFGFESVFLQATGSLAIATTQTAGDCNGNGIPDDEDIANGTSQDCNTNGIPDECDFVAELTATGVAFTSGSGARDVVFASFFYVYPPNANDRFVGQVSSTVYDLKDVAVDPTDSRIYTISMSTSALRGSSSQQLYLVDPVTGAGTALPQGITSAVTYPVLGLTFGLDGTLYGIGQAGFVILDKTTGAISQTINNDVFGFGMATSLTGQLYSVTIEPTDSNQPELNGNAGILQLHDPTTGVVTSSVTMTDPTPANRQVVDIAFGADGKLYGSVGWVYSKLPYFVSFSGQALVIIDPATGSWTDVGPYFSELNGLGGPRYKASLDCNKNGIPDECETDCNKNGIPDDCDIANGTSLDCNSNGVPDECDIVKGTSLDCNSNGVPDECDILSGTSTDANQNGIPDECDAPQASEEPPAGQSSSTGPFCILFLFQSLFGIPLCGPCGLAGLIATLVGMGGMKMYVRRRYNRTSDRAKK